MGDWLLGSPQFLASVYKPTYRIWNNSQNKKQKKAKESKKAKEKRKKKKEYNA